MKIWLEINRVSGVERREVHPEGTLGRCDGACPGCSATPFFVQGQGRHRLNQHTCRANGVAKCCGDSVGYIYATADTLFGTEEDEAVIVNSRGRVYGGGVRA